jgi:hypothetical protein
MKSAITGWRWAWRRPPGADLQRALEEGRITHGDWADVVTRCRGCGWTEGCDCWMAAQDGRAATVPQACPNAAFFEAVLERHGSVRTTRRLPPDTSAAPLRACRPRSPM